MGLGDRYWRSRAYSMRATMSKFAAASLDPGKEVGRLEGASGLLVGSIDPICGRRVCECHSATLNLAGKELLFCLDFGELEAGSERCKEQDN
jgi:hypothetical protein